MSAAGQAAGPSDKFAAPFQRVYTSIATGAVDIDLTTALSAQKVNRAASGLIVSCATAGNLVWQDCSGTTLTYAVPANTTGLQLPFAVTVIEDGTSDNLTVIAYWNR